MKTRSALFGLIFGASVALLSAAPASAQIEVPVSYELASGAPRIDGFLTGGSWCEPEGLSVTRKDASAPALVRYEDIDQLEALRLAGSNTLAMRIRLKDDGEFDATAAVPPGIPLLILRDEAAPGTASDSGKIRTFTPENFRGLTTIEFEAAVEEEADPQAVKELAERLGKAVESGNLQEAVDLHAQIGEMLDALVAPPAPQNAPNTSPNP
ncbi:MAG TPA: hypothetical protein PLU72_07900 [Candidatus Ozemobacteraceae bacterium]|nr:hypothetical protein [Candidatus Ozemobacteraceae bacterium]